MILIGITTHFPHGGQASILLHNYIVVLFDFSIFFLGSVCFFGEDPGWACGHFFDQLGSGYHVFSNERGELTTTLFGLITVGYHLELCIIMTFY